jgi:hypothetical protein
MRLARLAALGLAIGVIAGFAIALLRPRPNTSSTWWDEAGGQAAVEPPGELWDQFRKAEDSPAMQARATRRVKG